MSTDTGSPLPQPPHGDTIHIDKKRKVTAPSDEGHTNINDANTSTNNNMAEQTTVEDPKQPAVVDDEADKNEWDSMSSFYSREFRPRFQPMYDCVADVVGKDFVSKTQKETYRVLDVACGPGEPSITIANRLTQQQATPSATPVVEMVGIDLSAKMLRQAACQRDARIAATASAASEVSLRFVERTEESLLSSDRGDGDCGSDVGADYDVGGRPFDVVVCSLGLMYFADGERSMSNFAKLVGGSSGSGKVIITFWGEADEVPFLKFHKQNMIHFIDRAEDETIEALEDVEERTKAKEEAEAKRAARTEMMKAAGSFAYGGPAGRQRFDCVVDKAGLAVVATHDITLDMEFESFDTYWQFLEGKVAAAKSDAEAKRHLWDMLVEHGDKYVKRKASPLVVDNPAPAEAEVWTGRTLTLPSTCHVLVMECKESA
eukprot:TRINITY_DN7762_c0_g1_i1.p1 TRINITY_DN7762_c0_g1~~TRINITY_DN7762_c0_g1_i1.p1  ORF type:complete len:431 (+),score=104.15 TRINITY_DN7762_c0_g1_i1:131-1423(+)